jgi:hypothetical protein
MKKLTSTIIICIGGSFLSFLLLLAGCRGSDYKMIYTAFNSEVYNVHDMSNSHLISENDSCNYADHYMQLSFEVQVVQEYAALLPVSAAYAWQYGDPSYETIEKIKDIKVVSLEDYNNEIHAGDEIAQQCNFYTGNEYSIVADNDITNKDGAVNYLNDTYTQNNGTESTHDGKHIGLKIAVPPDHNGLQRFAIAVYTENNSVLRDTTVAFILQP